MEEKLKSKSLYKIFLGVLKYIPMILATVSALNSLLSYFYIDIVVLSYIGGTSLLPLLFIYLAAFVFKFCLYHRIFLDYVVVNNLINIIDYYIGIPITSLSLLCIQMILLFITLVIAVISHRKCKKDVVELDL